MQEYMTPGRKSFCGAKPKLILNRGKYMKDSLTIEYEKLVNDEKKKINEKDKWVDHPSHYNGHKIKTKKGEFEYETIDLISAVVNRLVEHGVSPDAAYCVGCTIKYIDRAGEKPADYVKDQASKTAQEFEKGAWYLTEAANKMKKD